MLPSVSLRMPLLEKKKNKNILMSVSISYLYLLQVYMKQAEKDNGCSLLLSE